MVKVLFAKTKEEARIPSKRDEDAGYDIFPCFEEDYIELEPHTTTMIPTGIASAFSQDYYFQIQERGSTGVKGMKYGGGVIDSGFRNEWQILITNTNDHPIFIMKDNATIAFADEREKEITRYSYSKGICQAILLPVPRTEIEEIPYEELKEIKSERGLDMLGSTNKDQKGKPKGWSTDPNYDNPVERSYELLKGSEVDDFAKVMHHINLNTKKCGDFSYSIQPVDGVHNV